MAGPADLVRLTAQVPGTAPYGAQHVLDLTHVQINGGAIPATDDDGLHVVSYFGDTTGSRSYSSADSSRALRLAVGLDSGFPAYRLTDPVIVALRDLASGSAMLVGYPDLTSALPVFVEKDLSVSFLGSTDEEILWFYTGCTTRLTLGQAGRLVASGAAAVAFAMYPVRIDDLIAIADAGGIMPPKSTWFEPKLRDGILVHVTSHF